MHDLQILLIEDDPSAALDVEMVLDEMGIKLAAVKNNAEDAINYINSEQPDLVIVDLELEGEKTGLDVANEIRHLQVPLIFTTSYNDKQRFDAAKGTHSFGYLVKPFDKLSLQSALEQAIRTLFPEGGLEPPSQENQEGRVLQDTILVKHVNIFYPIRLSDIHFVQGDGNYCFIHTISRRFLLKMSLRKLLDALPANEFSPVHKSFIVRLDKVEAIDVSSGKLTVGKEDLPLGRNFKNNFLDRFNLLK